MVDIDSELVNELIQPDESRNIGREAPIKGVAKHKIIDYDTEVDIGNKRTADILLTVQVESKQQHLVVEVENDRKPDFSETLRKIKRGKRYPTKVIIPKKFERFAWRFQKSGIPVWYWEGVFKWFCRDEKCSNITMSTSTFTPIRCDRCGSKGTLEWEGIEKIDFTEAGNNPDIIYSEGHIEFFAARRPR